MPVTDTDALSDRALWVLYNLQQKGPLTRAELEAETKMTERTLLRKLGELRDGGFVERDHPPGLAKPQYSAVRHYGETREC